MINVYNRARQKTAVLQNAYNVIETKELNAVSSLVFSLPDEDAKNAYCKPFHFIQYGDDGDLYRIIAPGALKSATGASNYVCEHVIATLIDDILWGAHTIGNIGIFTADCINYVLDRQTTRNWILDECDFTRQFEYGWECENLLAALFSIPNRFVESYKWVFNTQVYPWRLSLKLIDGDPLGRQPLAQKPQFYVRAGKNLLQAQVGGSGARDVCTRLYGLGYGEGVNQLTIREVNGGLPYIDAPQEYIDRYGLIARVFIDRRFEVAQSLKERMDALLDELKEPQYSRTISIVDLYELTQNEYDKAEIGRITMLTDDNTKTYITKTVKNHDEPWNMTITFATKATDIASSLADLADRQRIEQVYAQGATQIYAQSIQANATSSIGAVLNFYIPAEMRIVNAIKAKITLAAFRSYSRATHGGGASTPTSSSGGGSTPTSSSGGGSTQTTSTDSKKTATSSSGGSQNITTAATDYFTAVPQYNYTGYVDRINSTSGGMTTDTYTTYEAPAASHRHRVLQHYHSYAGLLSHRHDLGSHKHAMVHQHSFSVSSHTHTVSIPSHAHTVSIPSHSHTVNVPAHTHSVTIPDHTHSIEQGIFTFGSATGANIYVNGVMKGSMETDHEVDLTSYLLDESNQIPRGQWLRIEIRPNDLAYVTVDMFVQGFVQSRGGSTY